MPRLRVLCLLPLVALASVRASAADEERIFFRDPDKDTRDKIEFAMAHMATDAVGARRDARRTLEAIGYWSVEPLVGALTQPTSEPPVRCSAILVLDALHDRRAIEAFRASVTKETSTLYVAGFAALALGRARDAGAVETFRAALRAQKSTDMFRVASSFALAKIRTPEARELILERARASGGKEPIRSAALLSLGFFPDLAIEPGGGMQPTPEIKEGLDSKRRPEREAALLAYLVASWSKSDVKPFLRDFFAKESTPEVAQIALLGLSRGADPEITELLARTAERQGADRVKELAGDLLLDRVDDAVKGTVMSVARGAPSARLRAACVLAMGRLDDDDSRKLLADALSDHAPLVRAAGAVAMTRQPTPAGREAGLAALKARMKRGETHDDVRADFEKARAVLSGERADVVWTEVGSDWLFGEMPLTYSKRLLRAVNLRLMACLDLAKIQNLQTDVELAGSGPPSMPSDTPGGDPRTGETGGTGASGDDGSGASQGGGDQGGGDGGAADGGSSGGGGGVGGGGQSAGTQNARSSQYQELRDLKIELRRDPYFSFEDLPTPPTTPK
jgi:HEAT repeat protein